MRAPANMEFKPGSWREFEPKTLEKRTWCYAGPPISYGIPGHVCGCKDCVYSEYKDRLWCPICEVDFEPEHWGVFDGPILFEICQGLGMNFDRINLVDDTYEQFDGFDKDGKEKITVLRTKEEISARIEFLAKKSQDFLDKMGAEIYDGDKIRFKHHVSSTEITAAEQEVLSRVSQ